MYSDNKGIRQQLSPTRTYQQTKLQTQVPNTKCRMCDSQTETTSHTLSGCSKIAQSLYKARHDRMLRPIYHHLLQKYNFQENNNEKPWYMQSIPTAVVENANAKIIIGQSLSTGECPRKWYQQDRYSRIGQARPTSG